MPEGHVAHRNADRLTRALADRKIVGVDAPEPRLATQRIPERLAGDRVSAVEAVGKHLLMRFASGRVLHSHLLMSGSWRLRRAAEPLRRRGLWLALRTDHHVAAQYGGPVLRLYEPGDALPQVAALGLDLLAPEVDPADGMEAGLARVNPGTSVGEAIMNQRVVAGIGNVYKSESLFLCGIDPWRPVGTLTTDERRAVGATAARLLHEGVEAPGPITTVPGGPRGATFVHRRAGRPCRRCATPVRSRGQGDANRTTYWCPSCQS